MDFLIKKKRRKEQPLNQQMECKTCCFYAPLFQKRMKKNHDHQRHWWRRGIPQEDSPSNSIDLCSNIDIHHEKTPFQICLLYKFAKWSGKGLESRSLRPLRAAHVLWMKMLKSGGELQRGLNEWRRIISMQIVAVRYLQEFSGNPRS